MTVSLQGVARLHPSFEQQGPSTKLKYLTKLAQMLFWMHVQINLRGAAKVSRGLLYFR